MLGSLPMALTFARIAAIPLLTGLFYVDGDGARFMNAVALRTAPPRSSDRADAKAETKPEKPAAPAPDDPRSAMQKLLDKFR